MWVAADDEVGAGVSEAAGHSVCTGSAASGAGSAALRLSRRFAKPSY